jgi:hypothetical protein
MNIKEKVEANLKWFKDNLESDHTENMSDGYKDGLVFALQEYLGIEQSIQVVKTEEWLRGYKDGKQSIQDETLKQ